MREPDAVEYRAIFWQGGHARAGYAGVVPVEKPFEKNRFRDLGESDRVGCVRIDFVKRTGAKWFPRTAPNRRK